MDVRKTAVLLLVLALSLGLAFGYTASTGTTSNPSNPNADCDDGNDNDGDGRTDGNDPGCVKPYSDDGSEANVYDLDATWVFAGRQESNINSNGPTVFYGWKVVRTSSGSSDEDDVSSGSEGIDEAYVENSVPNWGGGIVRTKGVSLSGGDNTDGINSPFYEIIDTPEDSDFSDGTQDHCGDTISDSDEDTKNCPEDMGLPDDPSTYEQNGESSETMSAAFDHFTGQWGINNIASTGDPNHNAKGSYIWTSPSDDLNDDVYYDPGDSTNSFLAEEAEGTYDDSDISALDISGTKDSVEGDRTWEDQKWENIPDFYWKNEDELWAVYPVKNGNTKIGSVTDKDLTSNTYDDWDDDKDVSVCTGGGTNSTCASASGSYCTGISSNTVDDQDLSTDHTKDLSASTEQLETTASGHTYSEDRSSQSLDFTVTYDQEGGGTSNIEADNPSGCGTSLSTGCVATDAYGNGGDDCSWGTETVAEEDSSYTDYAPNLPGNYNKNYEDDTVTYYYEDLGYATVKVFDLNPAENPSGNPGGPKNILFYNDNFHGESYSNAIVRNSHSGDAYWSYEKTRDGKHMGNDQAVSSSSFRIRIDSNNEFVSVRNYFKTWDADGSEGQGDGFISVLHRRGYMGSGQEVRGWSNQFSQRESTGDANTNDASASFVTNPSDNSGNGHYQFDVPGCPDPFTNCVSAVDVSLRNLNDWANPTDPGAGADSADGLHWQFETQSTNESLGVCEMYQALDPQSVLQSNFDNDNDSPTKDSQRCVGDMVPDFWIYMEGPDVDESSVNDEPSNYETKADDVSDCNLRGNNVSEGTVADVSTQYYSDYEQRGHSPDWEVCLNIDQTVPGGPGDDRNGDNYDYDRDGVDEEAGGEWWDLDNERVNAYLRSGGPGHDLITGGDDTNASNIAYYWRENINPYHSVYNPEGGNKGIPLEDDCGRDSIPDNLLGCTEKETVNDEPQSKTPVFYTFFSVPVP